MDAKSGDTIAWRAHPGETDLADGPTTPCPVCGFPNPVDFHFCGGCGMAGADDGDPTATPANQTGPLDVRSLRHHSENSRLALALTVSGAFLLILVIGVGASDPWNLFPLAFVVAITGATIWFLLQVYRSRLLGSAVRVSEASLPDMQCAVDEVRHRLDYAKPVDVYITDKVDGGSSMTSYLGTRIVLLEGGLVAELLAENRRAELTFLIGRHLGALKAKHQRLTPVVILLSMIDALKFLQPFLAPYFRATVKSGDQIAAACCGDIRATAGMMNRLLVGKELGPSIATKGILEQAALVKRRWLPRMAQLLQSTPHATNRYLNLLAFFSRTSPAEIDAWRAALDPATQALLASVIPQWR